PSLSRKASSFALDAGQGSSLGRAGQRTKGEKRGKTLEHVARLGRFHLREESGAYQKERHQQGQRPGGGRTGSIRAPGRAPGAGNPQSDVEEVEERETNRDQDIHRFLLPLPGDRPDVSGIG